MLARDKQVAESFGSPSTFLLEKVYPDFPLNSKPHHSGHQEGGSPECAHMTSEPCVVPHFLRPPKPVRNPWIAKQEYYGDWCDDSSKWKENPEVLMVAKDVSWRRGIAGSTSRGCRF